MYTDEEGEDEENVREKKDVAIVGLLKVTSLPGSSVMLTGGAVTVS